MASGFTISLIEFSRTLRYRTIKPWEQKERDRSLRGKARVKARKNARKEAKANA